MKASRIIFITVGLLAVIGIWFWMKGGVEHSGTKSKKERGDRGGNQPVAVVLGTVEKKDFPIFLDGIGTVQAFNSVTVRARVDGELQKVLFTEGQDVNKGDLLAVIDPRPYQAQLDQAIAKKAQDEAQFNNGKLTLARYTSLIGKSVIDQQTFDTQKYLVDQLAATVRADEAALNNAQTQLGYTQIGAPISGRIGLRQVDEGNMIHATDTTGLLTITQLKPISVVFTLPEQDLSRIQDHSAEGPLKVFAFDHDYSRSMGEGVVAVIDNQIDQQTGTIKIKSTFSNDDLKLWPGQFVNARLLVTIRKDSLVIPASSVQRGPDGTFAYIVDKDNTAELRKIKVGPVEKNMTLVEEGVSANERIVVDGQYKLQPGSKVQEVPQPDQAVNRQLGSNNSMGEKVSETKSPSRDAAGEKKTKG